MPSRPVVFVHGSGRRGRDAWPGQVNVEDSRFLSLGDDPPTYEAQAAQILANAPQSAVVIAHSAGALPAVLAMQADPKRIDAIVLVEPALYGISEPGPAVRAHNERVRPVFDRAATSTTEQFWNAFFPALTGTDAPPLDGAHALAHAERLRTFPPPWSVPISRDVFSQLPTLVVTGGWEASYEEIAAALVSAGAHHEVLEGYGHRPQDHPDFTRLVIDWVVRVRRPEPNPTPPAKPVV